MYRCAVTVACLSHAHYKKRGGGEPGDEASCLSVGVIPWLLPRIQAKAGLGIDQSAVRVHVCI